MVAPEDHDGAPKGRLRRRRGRRAAPGAPAALLALALGLALALAAGPACTTLLGVTDIPVPADAGGRDGGSEARADAPRCEGGLAFCGTACVDTAGDPDHCGGCSARCAGTCQGGRCILTLVDIGREVCGLAVSATDVYFTSDTAVRSVPIGGGPVRLIAGAQNVAASVAVSRDGVIWGDEGSRELLKYVFASGTVDTLATGVSLPNGLAVDATDVYFTTSDSVAEVPLAGGAWRSLLNVKPFPQGIAVDTGYVYFGRLSTPGTIERVPKTTVDGGGHEVLVPNVRSPQSVAIDATHVYWTNAGATPTGGSVARVKKGGGPVETLAEEQRYPGPIGVDSADVYWAAAGTSGSGSVARVPLEGGAPATLVAGLIGPCAMALDATNVYVSTIDGKVLQIPKAP